MSFYYEPDLSAGSFRSSCLIKALLEKLPKNSEIEIVTTLPNRYGSYTTDALEFEKRSRVTIRRLKVSSHKSGNLDQSRLFIEFAIKTLRWLRGKDFDLVFATSSRLMTAVLASYIARRIKKPLYLDIRDIFADGIKYVLPTFLAHMLVPFFSSLERYAISYADHINLVSAGFLPYFEKRYSGKSFSLYTNGIDQEFINLQPNSKSVSTEKILQVVYAGNIGEGQGLHKIVPKIAKAFEDRLHIKIIGDGGRKKELEKALNEINCKNVEIFSPVKRDALIEFYNNSDVLFLHLNDYAPFLKVLPSKLFEYAALGKPIWAGVAGYPAQFISKNIDNSAVFHPCNLSSAIDSFENLEIVTKPRLQFINKFSRKNIMNKMAEDIVDLVTETEHK